MSRNSYKYIYGPVSSWRLGSSLGVDPISRNEKICSFDCIYCQLGKTDILTDERKNYVNVEYLISEFRSLPNIKIDYITFSGRGEPSLAGNLGEMIREVRKIRYAEGIAAIVREINADEVQLNTPLRKCPASPLPGEEMIGIEKIFSGLRIVSVYGAPKKPVTPISDSYTLKRRGKT